MIPLDAPRYQYFPFYIEVFRCSGACSTHSPKTIQCAAVTWNNVSGNIYDVYAETLKAVTFQNHTSCGCECVTKAEDCSENERFVEDRCSCDCKYPDNPPTPCPERFRYVFFFFCFFLFFDRLPLPFIESLYFLLERKEKQNRKLLLFRLTFFRDLIMIIIKINQCLYLK